MIRAMIRSFARKVTSDEKGATAVEYGIMVALIAVVIIVAVSLLGGNLSAMFGNVANQVPASNP